MTDIMLPSDNLTQLDSVFSDFPILKDFQKEGISRAHDFLHTNESKGVYIADEQGLGKSLQTIVLIRALKCRLVLVLCPAVMRLTWEAEFQKFAPEQFTVFPILNSIDASKIGSLPVDKPIVLVTSYDLAVREPLYSRLHHKKLTYDALVIDEAQYCNRYTAKRTRNTLKLWQKSKFKICLSGTPFTTQIVDAYTLFSRLKPTSFVSKVQFGERYSYPFRTPWGTKYKGGRNLAELKTLIRNSFFIRRIKSEVLSELPEKTYSTIYLDKKLAVDKECNHQKLLSDVQKLEKGELSDITELSSHRRLQGIAKAGSVVDYVNGLTCDSEIPPLVLFAYHRDVIAMLEKGLEKFKPVVVTGDTPEQDRFKAVEAFQSGKTNLFIGQIKAAGVGITLTRSSTVLLAELDWSPATVLQAVDRVHRIGQKNAVQIINFVVKDSIDEAVARVVFNKVRLFKQVLD